MVTNSQLIAMVEPTEQHDFFQQEFSLEFS